MKWMKRGLVAVAILVVFIVSAMIAVVLLVDPNDYKDQIAEAVTDATGRTLHIQGDSKLSVFPWLGLELNQVSLDNPPGFTREQFLSMQRLNIKVALLPLLSLKVKVGNVQLQGLQAYLERRADGVTNWDDLLSVADTETASAPATTVQPVAETGESPVAVMLRDFTVGGIDIEDANVTWHDVKAGVLTHIEYFNLQTGEIRSNGISSFSMQFALRNEQPKLIAGVEFSGRAAFDLGAQQYTLNGLDLNVKASGTVVPGNDREISAAVKQVRADLQQQALHVEGFTVESDGVKAAAGLDAQKILADKPQVEGDMQLSIASLRHLLRNLDLPVPLTTDDGVLGQLRVRSHFGGGLDALTLNDLKVQLDDSSLSGRLTVKSFAAPSYDFALSLDRINVDRYLPPPLSEEPDQPVSLPVETVDPELPLPVDALRELNATGEVQIGAMQVMNLNVADIKAVIKAGQGVLTVDPLSLQAYDGSFNGAIVLNVTDDRPVFSTDFKLASMQAGPLLQDYMKKRLIEGAMSAEGNLKTSGNRVSELEARLDGVLKLSFRDGTLSTDTRRALRESYAKLQRKLGKDVDADKPLGEPTKYSSITATAKIDNGVVNNDDLEVRARHMYVTGKGLFKLPDNYIDYVLTILLSDDGAGQDDPLNNLVDFPIDYHLKGKLQDLDYLKITGEALAGAVKAKLKGKLDAKKQQATAAARAKLEQEKAQLAERKRLAEEKKKAELEQKKKEEEEKLKQRLEEKKKKLLNKLFN